MLKLLLSDLGNPVAECSVARSLRSKLRIYSKEVIYDQNQYERYLLVKWEFSKKIFFHLHNLSR